MSLSSAPNDAFASLRVPDLRRLITASALSSLARSSMAVIIGFQIYALTKDPLALGLLGLIEAIPSVGLALYGGHIADRHDRRRIVLITGSTTALCGFAFSALSAWYASPPVWALYSIIFVAGIARGFASPASSAFEGQVVPRELFVNASAWNSSIWLVCSIAGPALAGMAYAEVGPATTYGVMAVMSVGSVISVSRIASRGIPPSSKEESIWESIGAGIKFVRGVQPLYGSMMLDLFAVFFGGAIALLPVFATDILHLGAREFGLMNAAPAAGALLVMLRSTKHPPIAHAGRNILFCVAGFGFSMILFGLSRNFYLSLFALALSGAFDGVSMVIRGAILRLLTPDHIRGRVSAVNWVFIGSSNELGALESGLAAKWLGAVRAVVAGGVVCLGVVGGIAAFLPELRDLKLTGTAQDEKG